MSFSKCKSKKQRHFGAIGQSEAVAQSCSGKKVFPEILQNSQENTCAQAFYFECCEISKNSFLHRTPLMAASGQ